MCHAFGLGYIYFFQPWQWGPLSCFLSSVFCLNYNYSCKVSGKEYNLGGWGEEGRVKPITKAPSFFSPSPSPFPLPLLPPWPSKITFKETKVNTEPYGSILIQQAIIFNVFLVVRDPQWNIFSFILKFTWQPGGQSDIVWCYFGLQI